MDKQPAFIAATFSLVTSNIYYNESPRLRVEKDAHVQTQNTRIDYRRGDIILYFLLIKVR